MADKIVHDLNALSSAKKPTLADVVKDFHLYVGSHERDIAANITFVLAGLRAATNFEKQLRIKLINKYHVHNEVLSLLKSGDSLNVNQALKCQWFFSDIADPIHFVRDFLPHLSLSARLKVLNKYASFLKNPTAAETIYNGVKSRYGTRTAVLMLPACGENFIRNELPNIKIALSPGIVLSLFKRYPSLTTEYIKYLAEDTKKPQNLASYETVIVKLASSDLDTFLELTGKHKSRLPYIKLGRRPTKKLLKTRENEVIENYSTYKWLLKEKIFFTRLSLDQIRKIYVKDLLPSSLSDFLMGARTALMTLGFFKPIVQSNLVLKAFKSKYGREMTSDDVLYKLEDTWVEYLPVEDKVKWFEDRIQKSAADPEAQAGYIAQLSVESSMPRLKKLIESQSNANVRASIVKSMVVTLRINQCSSGIKDFFAYVVKRFRNETARFRSGIVSEATSLGKLFLGLEPNDWAPIVEFINIMKLNHEVYDGFSNERALLKIIDLRVQNSLMKNGNVDCCLNDYFEIATGDSQSVNYEALKLCENTPYRSFCLQWLLNAASQLKWKHDDLKNGFYAKLYENVVKFNCKNPASAIPIPDWLARMIDEIVADDSTGRHTLNSITQCVKNSDVLLWRSILKRTTFRWFDCESICALLKFEPSFIRENILTIMEKAIGSRLEEYSSFYKKIRLFDSFGIPSQAAKFCRIALKLENAEFDVDEDSNLGSETSQPHAIGALAIILPSSEFLKVALVFAPVLSKVEDYSKETQALHDIQKAIGKSFINVTSAVDVFPVLQKFAVGDYLKFVSGSLIAVSLNVPENVILPMLNESLNCPVSLRKHYLKLLYKIAPVEERVGIFVNIFKTEKNISLRLVLFQLLRKAFIDEPDDDSYRMFKSILSQLTVEDAEALKEVFSVEGIGQDFVGRYLELIWQLSGSKWAGAVPKGKSDIVDMVSCDFIKLLSEGFSGELLSFELSEKLPSSCSPYVCLYLVHAPSNDVQALRVSKVMASLQPLIASSWDEYKFSNGRVFGVRAMISDFVHSMCDCSLSHLECSSVHPIQLLETLKQTLARLIKPQYFLRESFELDLTIKRLQHQRSHLPASSLTTSVIELYKSYLQGHIQCEHLVMKCFGELAPADIRSDLAFALTSDANPACQITGIDLLSAHVPNEEEVPKYKTLIETLSGCENPAVLALANDFFSRLTASII